MSGGRGERGGEPAVVEGWLAGARRVGQHEPPAGAIAHRVPETGTSVDPMRADLVANDELARAGWAAEELLRGLVVLSGAHSFCPTSSMFMALASTGRRATFGDPAGSDNPDPDSYTSVNGELLSITLGFGVRATVLKNPIVSAPIVGATKPHHLPEAIAALDIHLTDDEITSLEEPYTPHGPSWF